MYEQYRQDPESVSESWREFFQNYRPGGANLARPATPEVRLADDDSAALAGRRRPARDRPGTCYHRLSAAATTADDRGAAAQGRRRRSAPPPAPRPRPGPRRAPMGRRPRWGRAGARSPAAGGGRPEWWPT